MISYNILLGEKIVICFHYVKSIEDICLKRLPKNKEKKIISIIEGATVQGLIKKFLITLVPFPAP